MGKCWSCQSKKKGKKKGTGKGANNNENTNVNQTGTHGNGNQAGTYGNVNQVDTYGDKDGNGSQAGTHGNVNQTGTHGNGSQAGTYGDVNQADIYGNNGDNVNQADIYDNNGDNVNQANIYGNVNQADISDYSIPFNKDKNDMDNKKDDASPDKQSLKMNDSCYNPQTVLNKKVFRCIYCKVSDNQLMKKNNCDQESENINAGETLYCICCKK